MWFGLRGKSINQSFPDSWITPVHRCASNAPRIAHSRALNYNKNPRTCLGIHNVTDYRRLRPRYFCTPGGESERDYATIISLRVDLRDISFSRPCNISRESEKRFQETFIEITDETDRDPVEDFD